MNRKAPPKIAIIGGGWAGVAAAVRLQDAGWSPVIYESSAQLGGRAKTLARENSLGRPLDNGQHILLGAYTDSLALIQRFAKVDSSILRSPLHIHTVDGTLALQAPQWLQAPFHLLWAILTAKGISLREKIRWVRTLQRLKRAHWQVPMGMTVEQWLADEINTTVYRKIWEPLCLAALNTRPHQACARLFVKVLQDSFDREKTDSDLILPATGLSDLWLSTVEKMLDIRYHRPIRTMHETTTERWQIDQEVFDGVILASPPKSTARILAPLLPASELLSQLESFTYSAIGTAYLSFTEPVTLPYPIMALEETQTAIGQWVFDRRLCMKNTDQRGDISIVCSTADAWIGKPAAECIQALLQQLEQQIGCPLPKPLETQWILEKRATFQSTPHQARPQATTPLPHVFLAGDWTDTGYPAVLEGAVRSGQLAAQLCIQSFT